MIRSDPYRLPRRIRVVALITAVVASCATLSAVFGVFGFAGSTPWFSAAQAGVVAHCDPLHMTSKRHTCLRKAAQATALTHLAAR